MSRRIIPSFDTLPIELVYRILDNLDGQIIILSLHHVSKQLDTMINAYLRQTGYELNFHHITKSDFIRICQRMQPENVTSLTFSDQYTTSSQISLFLKFCIIEQFTRLHSLTLLHVEDEHLKVILKHALICPLISLSIQEKNKFYRSKTTATLLSTAIEQPSLRKLSLSLLEDGMDKIKWPISSTIQHLTLYHCHLKYFPIIFRQFSSLRTFFIKYCDFNDDEYIDSNVPLDLIPMRQLTSLFIENVSINMSKIESILLNTSLLTHFRLTGDIDKIDYQWEKLIQTKLPLLLHFEFFFRTKIEGNHENVTTDILIAPFRTSFWLEIKHWFVTVNKMVRINNDDTNSNHDIQLYSIPVCTPDFQYCSNHTRMTSSTAAEINKDPSIMDRVSTLSLKTKTMATTTTTTTTEKGENTLENSGSMKVIPSTYLFRNVSDLNIQMDSSWPCDFIQHLSSLIDLSRLEKLTLMNQCAEDSYPDTSMTVTDLLEKACNIHSLVITAICFDETLPNDMEHFCSFIPHHIKHLKIHIGIMDDIKIILERLDHLSSATFLFYNDEDHWQMTIREWLSERRDAIYYVEFNILHIWLGKKKCQTSQYTTMGNKRLKID